MKIKTSSQMEKLFLKVFYGNYKRHISDAYFYKGKIIIRSLCGRTSSKFYTTSFEDATCKNCLKSFHE
jgi:hypothetical protein